jgi:hypothetical protein
MALQLAGTVGGQAWEGLRALVDADGGGTHPYFRRLCAADRRGRRVAVFAVAVERRADAEDIAPVGRIDLADAVHALCAVHGAHRGLAEEARDHPATGPAAAIAGDWLADVAHGFAAERGELARILSAAGPLPSTPGQAATDAALVAQRHAFRMLGWSDRTGCATGAVAALVLDWTAVRRVLARAAEAYGTALAPCALPDPAETATVLGLVADTNPVERAMLFGARALLAQHRALWDLLAARASARLG